jgi:signal peptidase I
MPKAKSPEPPSRFMVKVREYFKAFLWAVILALLIRTFVVEPFKIPSGSMENTLLIGDHLLVNKFIYGTEIPFTHMRVLPLRKPERGDVIVFTFPPDADRPFWAQRDFIKRVIGLPGDTVKVRDKQVYINGMPYQTPQAIYKDPNRVMGDSPECLEENTFPRSEFCRDYMPPIKVPPGKYFVMGDNRDLSFDSRFWGFVDQWEIKGPAFILYWSWDGGTDSVRWNRIGKLIH